MPRAPSLHAFDVAGSERPGFPVDMAAVLPARSEVAIGDVDQNGVEDLVLAMASPARLEVRDSTGASLAGFGWPRAMPSAATGAPVLGHLTGGGAPEIMALLASGLTGFSNVADSLPRISQARRRGHVPDAGRPRRRRHHRSAGRQHPRSSAVRLRRGSFERRAVGTALADLPGQLLENGLGEGRALPVTLDLIAPGAVNDLTAEVTE